MAKILVADDNSNVQKTVALALADLSVEVVAVNNGEAAVRKLADISPDLILADIFMPVRNGYEVCEFVKKDTRFAQVPVVLLVGAFDPLDEREAERVGADGILKKPFVPPDPLIAMVKALLDRSMSERLVTVGASKPAAAMQQGKTGGTTVEERPSAPPAPEPAPEMPVEEFQPPIKPVSFGEGERPIAFGQLLESPAPEPAPTEVLEPVDDSQILTSSRDASLGEPIFWKTEEPEPEAEDENAETEQDLTAEPPERPWKPDGLGVAPSSEAPLETDHAQSTEPAEPFELVREEEESAQPSTAVEAESLIAQDAASQASLTVQAGRVEDLAANPIEWMASAPPPPPVEEEAPEAAADWSATDSEAADNFAAQEISDLDSLPESAHAKPTPTILSPVATVNSTPASAVKPVPPAPPSQSQAKPSIEIPSPNKTQPSLTIKPFPQSAEDTARSIPKQEWADLAASLQPKAVEPVAEKPKPAAPPLAQVPSNPAANLQPPADSAAQPSTTSAVNASSVSATSPLPPSPDPALVEAVVQRVLEKMRPQVVDIITKEFLRPVVQALVHREITKR